MVQVPAPPPDCEGPAVGHVVVVMSGLSQRTPGSVRVTCRRAAAVWMTSQSYAMD